MKKITSFIFIVLLYITFSLSASGSEIFTAIQNRDLIFLEKLLREGQNPDALNSEGETPLMKAKSDPDMCKMLLKYGADINFRNKDGKTFLMVLGNDRYNTKRVQVFEQVIKNSKKIIHYDIQDNEGMSALMYAVSYEYTDDALSLIRLLIDHTKNYNITDKKNKTALEHAVDYTSIKTAIYLIQKGGVVKIRTSENRNNAFLAASIKGDLNEMKKLQSKGVPVTAKTKHLTANALILASAMGHAEIVKYLLSEKLSARSADHFNKSALMYAGENGNVNIMDLLIKNGAMVNKIGGYMNSGSPLIDTATAGNIKAVEFLLQKGAEINLPNDVGLPAVHYAAMHEHIDMVKYLVGKGARLDVKSKEGYPLLAYLFYYISETKIFRDLVLFYLDNGADPNDKSMFFKTYLMHAISLGDFSIVQKLVEKGADINASDKEHDNALLVAIRYKHFQVARYLINKNIKISKQAATKGVYYLVGQDNTEFMPFMIKSGADLNTEMQLGYKAIHLSILNNKHKMLLYLIENGADVNAKCSKNKTALDYAIERNNSYAQEILKKAGAKSQATTKNDSPKKKSKVSFDDYTKFLTASKNGDLKTVRDMVTQGMYISFSLSGGKDIEPGMTPLMLASREGHVEIVRFLLENKAVVSTVNDKDKNKTALQYAIDKNHKDIIELLQNAGAR